MLTARWEETLILSPYPPSPLAKAPLVPGPPPACSSPPAGPLRRCLPPRSFGFGERRGAGQQRGEGRTLCHMDFLLRACCVTGVPYVSRNPPQVPGCQKDTKRHSCKSWHVSSTAHRATKRLAVEEPWDYWNSQGTSGMCCNSSCYHSNRPRFKGRMLIMIWGVGNVGQSEHV